MDNKAKQAINYIVKQIVKNGLVQLSRDGEAYYVIEFTKTADSFEASVREVDGGEPAELVAGTDSEGNQALSIPLPQYEDETFIEDEHDALMLDLTFIVSEWLSAIKDFSQRSAAGKKARGQKTTKERSDQARKAAHARWRGK